MQSPDSSTTAAVDGGDIARLTSDLRAALAEAKELSSQLRATIATSSPIPVELVDADGLGIMLSQSRPTIYRMNDDGRIPAPVEIGLRGCRWRVREIQAWLSAGQPVRNRWEQIKSGEMRRSA